MRVGEYYSKASARLNASCIDCLESDLVATSVGLLLAAVAAAIAIPLTLVVLLRQLPEHVHLKLKRLWVATRPDNKLKIVAGFYMIVTKIDIVYEVTMPATVRHVLSYIGFTISLGLGDTTAVLTCLGFRGFLYRLIAWMVRTS